MATDWKLKVFSLKEGFLQPDYKNIVLRQTPGSDQPNPVRLLSPNRWKTLASYLILPQTLPVVLYGLQIKFNEKHGISLKKTRSLKLT